MKVWTKVQIRDKNKQVELISQALTNYLYTYGPINNIFQKYNISLTDQINFTKHISNRIAGLLMLYLTSNYNRINDIVNKYNINTLKLSEIKPEIEGYIEKK